MYLCIYFYHLPSPASPCPAACWALHASLPAVPVPARWPSHCSTDQELPELLGWQPHRSTQLLEKKNIDDVSLGTALSNCWKCWKLTLLASVLQFIFALTRTKSSLFFLHSFFYRLKQCSPAMRPLFKISFSEAVLAFFFFSTFFSLQVIYLILTSIFIHICNLHCRVHLCLVTSTLLEHISFWKLHFIYTWKETKPLLFFFPCCRIRCCILASDARFNIDSNESVSTSSCRSGQVRGVSGAPSPRKVIQSWLSHVLVITLILQQSYTMSAS